MADTVKLYPYGGQGTQVSLFDIYQILEDLFNAYWAAFMSLGGGGLFVVFLYYFKIRLCRAEGYVGEGAPAMAKQAEYGQ